MFAVMVAIMIKSTDHKTATACYIRAKKLRAVRAHMTLSEVGAAAFCLEAAAQRLDRRNYWAIAGKVTACVIVITLVAGIISGIAGIVSL